MLRRILLLGGLLPLLSCLSQPRVPALAIRDVTVIPMMDGSPLEHATVLIRNDRIAAVGPSAEVDIPAGATIIDGAGRLRTRIGVGTPEDAQRVVDSLAPLELDFLEIRTVQNLATYRAINEAAERHGLEVVGHVLGLTPERVLEAGQDGVEHFFYPVLDDKTREERMALWRQFRARGIAIVPTLVTFTRSAFPPTDSLRAIVEDSPGAIEPDRRYLSRFLVLDWREQVLEADDDTRELLRGVFPSIVRNLREMHEAGVSVLAGSDVAVINIFPGSSLHEEIALFVAEIGMTPQEALAAATIRSAEFLGIADSAGTIEVGKVADLVLLGGNPLEDISNLERIEAVVLRGRMLDSAELDQVFEDVLRAPDLRVNVWRK